MITQFVAIAIVATALPGAALAGSDTTDTLTRSGKWILNYDADSCQLLAEFGTGRNTLLMRITRYQPGDDFELGLYGDKAASNEARSKARIDFGLGPPFTAEAVNGTSGKTRAAFFGSMRLDGWHGATPEAVAPVLPTEREAAVTGVTVAIRTRKPFHLQFGSLAKPMEQLRTCQSDLVQSWGYDPAVQAALTRHVHASNRGTAWLDASDYPQGATMMGQNGFVQFRLDVDPTGKVAGCHVLARTSPDVFADITCRGVSKRAKFEPALDAAGKPVRSYYVRRVQWQVGN